MDIEKKIDKIYKAIANKELSIGCKIKFLGNDAHYIFYNGVYIDKNTLYNLDPRGDEENDDIKIENNIVYIKDPDSYSHNIKVIGHPVMIGNCILIEKLQDCKKHWTEIKNIRTDKDEPIEYQSIECINKIYSLII